MNDALRSYYQHLKLGKGRGESLRLAANGITLHAVAVGAVDGPLVILLHGFPEFWYGWHEQMAALARAGFRVIVPDQRGYNTSDKPSGLDAYTQPTLTDDISGLIDALKYDAVDLAGHDLGAFVGWRVALTRPRQVRRLVVFSMAHPMAFIDLQDGSVESSALVRLVRFFQWPWVPEILAPFGDWYLPVRALRETSRAGTFSDAEISYYKSAWQNEGAVRAMIDWFRAGVSHPPPVEGDGMVDAPTLIVWGSRDVVLPARLAALSAQYCRDARVVEMPDAGHWLLHEQPEATSRQLVDFFSAS